MTETTEGASGDRQQRFLALIRENDARLSRICRVYGRASGTELDLYQDILVQAWRSLESFAGRAAPATWLYRVALNTALTHGRRQVMRREAPLERATESARARDPAPRPDEALERADRLECLYAAIDRLDDADKALVMLYLDERSYHEMAEVLGLTESHVGVKLHRIRRRLTDWLAEEKP